MTTLKLDGRIVVRLVATNGPVAIFELGKVPEDESHGIVKVGNLELMAGQSVFIDRSESGIDLTMRR